MSTQTGTSSESVGESADLEVRVPPVSSQSKQRYTADVKWRMNMKICFSLLRHSDRFPRNRKKRRGKISKVDALQQTLEQIPRIESIISALLEERNRRSGENESIEDIRDKFKQLTSQVPEHMAYLRRGGKYSVDLQGSRSKEANQYLTTYPPLISPVYTCLSRSESRSSIAASSISDISVSSSNTDGGMRSYTDSPVSSTSSWPIVSENDLEVENGPSSHPPVLQLHPTNIYIVPRNNIPVPSNRTPSCSGVIYPQPHPPPHPATLQLNNMSFVVGSSQPQPVRRIMMERFVNLQSLHQCGDLIAQPAVYQGGETNNIQTARPRQIVCKPPTTGVTHCQGLICSPQIITPLQDSQFEIERSEDTKYDHNLADLDPDSDECRLGDSDDLLMYDSSPETSKLRNKRRDPMLFVGDSAVHDPVISAFKRRKLSSAFNSPKECQPIMSPWKVKDVELGEAELVYRLEN